MKLGQNSILISRPLLGEYAEHADNLKYRETPCCLFTAHKKGDRNGLSLPKNWF